MESSIKKKSNEALEEYFNTIADRETLTEDINNAVIDLAIVADGDNAYAISRAADLLKTFKDILAIA